MKLSDISTDRTGVAEVKENELLIHDGRLAMFFSFDVTNSLARIQFLDDLEIALIYVEKDSLLDRVSSVRIHQ